MNGESISLLVTAPDSPGRQILCDSVHLTLDGGENGRGSGSYGIRPDHASALFALGIGPLSVFLKNKLVFSAELRNGFAIFKDNTLTVAADSFTENPITIESHA